VYNAAGAASVVVFDEGQDWQRLGVTPLVDLVLTVIGS